MQPIEHITVFLSPFEAEQFKDFQKYHFLFTELEKHKAFDIKFGKIVLNFAFGDLQNIIKEEVVYKVKAL